MKHFSTLYVGLDVHKESIAVAYVSDAKTELANRSYSAAYPGVLCQRAGL
jgi:hypothetical protein